MGVAHARLCAVIEYPPALTKWLIAQGSKVPPAPRYTERHGFTPVCPVQVRTRSPGNTRQKAHTDLANRVLGPPRTVRRCASTRLWNSDHCHRAKLTSP